jgi:predicted dehydrogenase
MKSMPPHPKQTTRRQFLATSASLVAPLILPASAIGRDNRIPPSQRINLGLIGAGSQGWSVANGIINLPGTQLTRVCDVDQKAAAKAKDRIDQFYKSPDTQVFHDYRELLDSDKLDAVIIGTPDHWHAAIATAAIQAGKHVYCEKPLTHTVGQARALRELSQKSPVATQTGNQGAASDNFRRSIELIQAGLIGTVSEIHVWHPQHNWPNGENRAATPDPIPDELDWNFWLGPAPARPYKTKKYHPILWRGWYDFGGGSLADFCCHSFSMPIRALELDYPETIQVSGDGLGMDSFPTWCRVQFSFPARNSRPPVSLFFHSGHEIYPPDHLLSGFRETFGSIEPTGCILVGSLGTLSAGLWNNNCYLRMNHETEFKHADKHQAANAVPTRLPRVGGRHALEWINACQGVGKTFSNFDVGGHATEIGCAGLIALQLGHNITWNGQPMLANPGQHLVNPPPRSEARQYL